MHFTSNSICQRDRLFRERNKRCHLSLFKKFNFPSFVCTIEKLWMEKAIKNFEGGLLQIPRNNNRESSCYPLLQPAVVIKSDFGDCSGPRAAKREKKKSAKKIEEQAVTSGLVRLETRFATALYERVPYILLRLPLKVLPIFALALLCQRDLECC